MELQRRHFWTVLIALLALRLIVGFHFFSEGYSKVKSGNFSCAGFLNQARGPLAPHFHRLLDDYDGRLRLSIAEDMSINTDQTFAIWDDFVDSICRQKELDDSQVKQTQLVLSQSKKHLTGFLAGNELEILGWISGEDRLAGFQRDGEYRTETADHVESLYGQVQTIRRDRDKVARPWFSEVEATWDELESRINGIAGITSADERIGLSRPFAPEWSSQYIIDRFLPWFDLIVGSLLIVGLFSRVAALAGIGLLLGVVATQPFWVMGAQNTYYQWIEIAGLLVLFATAAGRFGGLDYFLSRRNATVDEA